MSEFRSFYIYFHFLPGAIERQAIESSLKESFCTIEDFRYNFKRKELVYRLTTEQYQKFIDKFTMTEYWNKAEIKNVPRT